MYASERIVLEGPGQLMTVRHLTLRGTNFEIGRRLGEIAMERFGATRDRLQAPAAYVRARRAYLQREYPIQWERVRGVAAAFGIRADDERFDLTGLSYNADVPVPAPGCSVVYYPPSTVAGGGGLLSRNYDFWTGSIASLLGVPLPPEVLAETPAVMGDPYVMEWYPEDGGYASLAIHSFDLMSGTLDGMNSAGLAVSIMADEEALAELGSRVERQTGPTMATGLHELQVMRLLLDTCATVDEAEQALLTAKQYYRFAPCHYIVADRAGRSFIYENSTGRNTQYVLEGDGRPQVVTNFQIYRHPATEAVFGEPLSVANNAFWRYQMLARQVESHEGRFTPDDAKAANACVGIRQMLDTLNGDPAGPAVEVGSRTLWHSLYDQQAGTVDFSFFIGEDVGADGAARERRSEYLRFALDASSPGSWPPSALEKRLQPVPQLAE